MKSANVTRSRDPEIIMRKIRGLWVLGGGDFRFGSGEIIQQVARGEMAVEDAVRGYEGVLSPDDAGYVNWACERACVRFAGICAGNTCPPEFNGETMLCLHHELFQDCDENAGKYRTTWSDRSKYHEDPDKIADNVTHFMPGFVSDVVNKAFRSEHDMARGLARKWHWLGALNAFERWNGAVEYALFEAACTMKGYDLAFTQDDMKDILQAWEEAIGDWDITGRRYEKLANIIERGLIVADPELAAKHVGEEAVKRQTASEMLDKCIKKIISPDEYKSFLLVEAGKLEANYKPYTMCHGCRGNIKVDGEYVIRDLGPDDFEIVMERYKMAFEDRDGWHARRILRTRDMADGTGFDQEYRGIVRIILERGTCLGALTGENKLAAMLLAFDYGAVLQDMDLFWMLFRVDEDGYVLYPGTVHRRMRFYLRDGRVQFLWAMCTDPDHRNRGVMKKLVDTWLDRDPGATHCAFCYGSGQETFCLGDFDFDIANCSDGRYWFMADRPIDESFEYLPSLWAPEALEYKAKHSLIPAGLNIKAKLERRSALKEATEHRMGLKHRIKTVKSNVNVNPPWWKENSLDILERRYIRLARLDKLLGK